jgi:hypothetical protein
MRLKCSRCLHNIAVEPDDRGAITCPDCGFCLRGNKAVAAVGRPRAILRPAPRRRGAPPHDLEEYEEERQERHEEREERRDERLFRREERQDLREERREEKERNGFAIAGFCIALACLLLVAGGLVFSRQLPFYLLFALTLSLPGALAGLILSLLGLFMCRAMRPLGVAGAILAALLLLILIPAGFLLLKF